MRLAGLELNNSPAYSYGDGLSTIACAKLLHYVLDMALYRLFRDKEQRCDIAISISSSDIVKDFHLTFAQGFLAEVFYQMRGDFRRNMFLPCMDPSNHLNKLLSRHALQHVSLCPRFQG